MSTLVEAVRARFPNTDFSDSQFEVYSATEYMDLASGVLLGHQGPSQAKHVFGNILDRLDDGTKEYCLWLQNIMLKQVECIAALCD